MKPMMMSENRDIDGVLEVLSITHLMYEGILDVLEEAELYEECATILKDIHEIEAEIDKYEHYKFIEQQTGRKFDIRLPHDSKE
jgi:hypothetical protein